MIRTETTRLQALLTNWKRLIILLDAANTDTHGSEIPDWWEVKYFGRVGMDPNFAPAGDGFTLLVDYERGLDTPMSSIFL